MVNDIVNEIARQLNNNVDEAIGAAQYGTGISLGTVTETGLAVDSIKGEYQKGDYWILDNLNNPEEITSEISNNHSHSIKLPANQSKIKPGDRVLVAVLGVNAVIIGRVSRG